MRENRKSLLPVIRAQATDLIVLKNAHRVLERLLNHLSENRVQFWQITKEELKGKAAVEFSFHLGVPPTILWGPFKDTAR